MVVFNCNACGEALKKNQVEKHTMRCRNCEVLSCVDCGKDFWGNDYQAHTKCITEEQKYCGKGYVPKVNKGEVKQEQWIEKVQNAIENSMSNPKLKGLLERLKDYPNIPRKKSKFENFLKNSLRVNSDPLISQVWDTLMATAGQVEGIQNGHEKAKAVNEPESHKLPKNGVQENDATNGNDKIKKKTNKGKHKSENDNAGSRKRKLSEEETVEDEITEKSAKAELLENSDSRLHGESSVDGHKLSRREKKEERRNKTNKKEKKDKNENNCSNEGTKRKKRKLSEIEAAEVIHENPEKKSESLEDNDILERSRNSECLPVCDETNGENDEEALQPKKKKCKKVKFNWEATILTVLKSKGEISLKKLQKKVICEFAAQDAANYSEDNLRAKFNKKVNSMARVKVFKDRVKLK